MSRLRSSAFCEGYLHVGVGVLEELELGALAGVDGGVEVALEVCVADFVGGFVFAVVFVVLLHGVVGEVDELVVEVLHVELFAGGADVAVLVPVALEMSVETGDYHVGADVELPFLVQERVYVLLDYVRAGASLAVHSLPPHYLSDLFDALHHLDPHALVGVLAGLHQPGVPLAGFEAGCVFALLLFFLELVLLDGFGPFVVLLLEEGELLAGQIGDVEGHGNVLKGVHVEGLVVDLQVHEQCFFVVQVPVVGEVVVALQMVASVCVYLLSVALYGRSQSSLLPYHFQSLQLAHLCVAEELAVVVVDWPHLGVGQGLFLLHWALLLTHP